MAVGSIQKKKNIYYVVYYGVNGKQIWKKAGPRKKDAERLQVDIMSQINDGSYLELKEIGFQDFGKMWLRDYVRGSTKESTYVDYENIIRNHLSKYFGNRKLTNIDIQSVQAYLSHKVTEDRLKAKTINGTLVVLKQMLKHAVLWGYLKNNPALSVKKLREEKVEMRFLTIEEVKVFLEYIRTKDPKYYPLFLTAVMTGMRLGELLALKWENISWLNNHIRVRQSLSFNGKFTDPKTSSSKRSITMSENLKKVLRRHQLECTPSELDLVFPNELGKPLERHNIVNRHFKPALRKSGVTNIRFHDIRHTFASILIHQGENIKLVQHQLGHSSIQTTIDRYGHLMPDTFNQSAERLDQTIFGIENPIRKPLENPQIRPKILAPI